MLNQETKELYNQFSRETVEGYLTEMKETALEYGKANPLQQDTEEYLTARKAWEMGVF